MKQWSSKKNNRKAAVAGRFYPESKEKLEQELTKLFGAAKTKAENQLPIQAIISPHAGYVFSGKIAASAFNQIPDNATYKRVFVLASSHQYYFKGATIYTQGNYETPLGEIEVDKELGRKISNNSSIFIDKPEAHANEHSLEVQLPFLQYRLGNNFKLIPILLGTNKADDCKEIAKALKPYFNSENLFVISSDFSHFPNYETANRIDLLTAESICSNSVTNLLATLEQNKSYKPDDFSTSLCGWTSVLSLLYLSEGNNFEYTQIDYQNSGDAKVYGDKKRVVGYWAIAIFNKSTVFSISDEEKCELLEIARNSIKNYLETDKSEKTIVPKTSGILNDKTGVFVSVYINNELRGCIGAFAQEKTLVELIPQMAVSSVCDTRFNKVTVEELESMTLEVSVLSPLKPIKSADEIILGKHGIYIKSSYNTGTFLPQVIEKTKWNVNEFLGHCSRDKARLGWNGWKTAELYTYEAVIIKEAN